MTEPAITPVLEARAIRREFREGPSTLTVLEGVNLRIVAGERLAIVGASGSGKTTLLQILGGLDRPTARHGRDRRPRHPRARRGRARRPAQPHARLRLPVPSPAAGVQRAGERGDAAAGAAHADRGGAASGRGAAGAGGARRRGSATGRTSSPVASASAPPWRGRW